MNRIVIFLLAAFLTAANLNATDLGVGISSEKTFSLNHKVGDNEIKFISSAPLEDITGTVKKGFINSSFKINPSNAESASGKINFEIEGMETGIELRNEHMRSEEWLDAGKYPEISFNLTSFDKIKVRSSGGKVEFTANAKGTFNMHGKSKTFSIPVTVIYIKESEASRKRAPGDLIFIKGKFKVALKDFGVKGKKGIVGSKVGEKIDIEFSLFYNSK